nr:hypothetical protein [Tanacetum cinerariifolium]
SSSSEDFHESSSSESSEGCAASVLWRSVGSTGVVALKVPMNSILSRDGRPPGHEVVNDDFCESGVIHLIASLLNFVLHLIHKVLPDQIGKVDVDSVIESLKHLSLRQSETVNSRAFA